MIRAGTKYVNAERSTQILFDETQNYAIYREKEYWIPIKTPITTGANYGAGIPAINENIFEPIVTRFSPTGTDLKAVGMIADLGRSIDSVMENFGDIRDRQVFFFDFKEKLNELWKISTGDNRKAVLRLESAIKNLKSETLTEEQVEALRAAISILRRVDRETKQKLQKVLLDAGIFTTPVIEGLSEMYADEYD